MLGIFSRFLGTSPIVSVVHYLDPVWYAIRQPLCCVLRTSRTKSMDQHGCPKMDHCGCQKRSVLLEKQRRIPQKEHQILSLRHNFPAFWTTVPAMWLGGGMVVGSSWSSERYDHFSTTAAVSVPSEPSEFASEVFLEHSFSDDWTACPCSSHTGPPESCACKRISLLFFEVLKRK